MCWRRAARSIRPVLDAASHTALDLGSRLNSSYSLDPSVHPGGVNVIFSGAGERRTCAKLGNMLAQARQYHTIRRASVDADTHLKGGRLVYAQRAEPRTLNPVTATDNASREVIHRITADLIHVNRLSQHTEPALAKSWSVSPGVLHYVLELRRGVRFSDGHPFDADLDKSVHGAATPSGAYVSGRPAFSSGSHPAEGLGLGLITCTRLVYIGRLIAPTKNDRKNRGERNEDHWANP